MPDQDCPKEEEFRDWLAGRMPVEAAERLFAHLDSCPRCQAKLQTVRDVGDTLIDCLRQPWVRDELQDEPQFREAVARTKLIGDAPPTCDLAGRKGEPKPEILGELGEYQILEKLARGGMGTVYKALHTKLGREVALKVLPVGGLGSEEAIARFEREMKAVGQLDHPHIVRALDAREVGGTRFLVLEYIDGEDLSRLVRRRGPLTVAEACRLVRQAAVGLQYAHEHKLIHRDVKPSNLMIDRQGQLKILDLGLARFRPAEPAGEEMTRSGETMGTIEYMAPEQASDTHSVDVRADIYGLGCTLHYLLIGRAPYAGETAYQTLKAHHESPIPSLRAERSDVPEKLDRVFQKMVAKTPAERQASMSEVIADLDACLAQAEESEGAAKSSEPPSLSSRPRWRMRRVVLIAAALALPLLLAGLVLRLMTPQGMLVLRVDQQEADVVIDDGKITITTRDDEQPTEIRLEAGDHKLAVSKGGFEARVETVTIKSGAREAVHVTLEPLPAGARIAAAKPPHESHVAAWTEILPRDAPPPAVAPFDADKAKQHQQAWAKYLGLPVEREIELAGGEKLTLVLIPPGEFLMGSPEEERTRFLKEALAAGDGWAATWIPSEGPQHRVKITQPFYLGRYEVTQAQWEAVMETNPSHTKDPASPVEQVTWEDTQPLLEKLSAQHAKEAIKFVLPTEAQWEYACRAGTTTAWHFGDSAEALSEFANSTGTPSRVGELKPNPWGLHDMHGSAWEWCADWHGQAYYAESPSNDPQGPVATRRVNRGGSFVGRPMTCRSAFRNHGRPYAHDPNLGLRLAVVLVDKSSRSEAAQPKSSPRQVQARE